MEERRILSGQDAQIIHEIVSEAAEKAAINALKIIRKEEKEKERKKYDKRLQNTLLLLKNYKNLKWHIENANYIDGELRIEELIDAKIDVENDNDRMYINSILRTKKRTEIIIKHIDNCIEYYTYKCLASKKEDVQRRIQIINFLFFSDKEMSYNDIAKELGRNMHKDGGTC